MKWRLFRQTRRGSKRPVAAIWLRFAVVCILLLTGWSVSLSRQALGADAAPVVVCADSRKPAEVSEAAVLAHRILARKTDDLLFDAKRRRELTRDIVDVLKRLRNAHPEVAEISAREAHRPGVLLLGVKPDLMGTVSRLLRRQKGGPVKLRTGKAAFDALNARLGLRAVRLFRRTGVLLMHLNERLNIAAARRAYLKIAGIEYAESDAHLGDGSDIEASKTDSVWHLVVRKAWGDCPAGCIYKKMFFFTVRGEKIERIEPSKATGMPEFRKLLSMRRWR